MSQQENWVARSLRQVWHPCTQMQHHQTTPLLALSHGRGAYLYDMDGKSYLDGISSWWVNLFGHANPRIGHALKDQLDKLEHAMLAGFTHAPVVELSERLSALTDNQLGHSFYASDGASAVEIALKMSFHAWRNQGRSEKQEFICLRGSYHGETVGALAVTDVSLFREAYGPMLQRAHVLSSPDARLAEEGEDAITIVQRSIAELSCFLSEHGQRIAAIIVEPLVQCATGMAMYDPLYLRELRALCDKHQVHLIADEIAVGCGRTGTFFACEQAGIWPDFLCLSKGISGGYLPLSLVMTTEQIYQCFYDQDIRRGFLHSHSYTGNPLACRAALATLDIFASDDVLNQNLQNSAYFASLLAPLAQRPEVRHLRQCGTIFAFDVALSDAQRAKSFSRDFFAAALKRGVLLRPIGHTVYFMPPYILEKADFDLLAATTNEVLAEVLS